MRPAPTHRTMPSNRAGALIHTCRQKTRPAMPRRQTLPTPPYVVRSAIHRSEDTPLEAESSIAEICDIEAQGSRRSFFRINAYLATNPEAVSRIGTHELSAITLQG